MRSAHAAKCLTPADFKMLGSRPMNRKRSRVILSAFLVWMSSPLSALPGLEAQALPPQSPPGHPIVLHAERLLDIRAGRIVVPGEVLVEGDQIVEVGQSVRHPAGAEVIDLGDRTLMPGMIDAHVHLFLHPGAEDLQTVEESVPQRTIMAT